MKTCIRLKMPHLFLYPFTIKLSFLKFKVLVPILEYTVIRWIHDGEPVFSKRCAMGPSQ